MTRAGRIVPLTPTRIFDSRPSEPPPGPKGFIAADTAVDVQTTGLGGVPATGVSAVVMNLTATQAAGTGFITAYPTGTDRPLTSTLNLTAGLTAANLLIIPVGEGGKITLYSQAGAHLLADVTGYVTDETAPPSLEGLLVPLQPARVHDTRPGEPAPGPKGRLPPQGTVTIQFSGVAGIPAAGVGAVVVTITATQADTGFVTTWPTGTDRPLTSTLNTISPNDTRANSAILPLQANGQLNHYLLNPAYTLSDTSGYITG